MDFTETDLRYRFESELWLHEGEGAWVFASLPHETADEIEEVAPHHGGFGSVPVRVVIGDSSWKTSLFPDSKRGTYLLPIKRSVRDREQIEVGDAVVIEVALLVPA